MSTEARHIKDTSTPGCWERGEIGEIERWECGDLYVTLERQRIPMQMSDPGMATDDTGYVARVSDGDVGEQLSPRLCAREVAREYAMRFMRAYPDGEYEPRQFGLDEWHFGVM